MTGLTITRAGAEALDRVRPLWLELHRHHQVVGGEALRPYVDDATSWAARRAMYESLLGREHSFLLLGERDRELLAYAMVAVTPLEETWVHDTWRAGPLIAEIETLSVTAAARGDGIGSALLDRIDAELAAAGIGDVVIGAFATNADALRLYERRGFRATWLYLSRFAGR